MRDFPRKMHVRLGVALAFAMLLGSGVYLTSFAPSTAPLPERRAQQPAPSAETPVQPVNAVIGDESYRVTFGTAPSAETSERLRLQTHLAYVEGLLRAKDVSHLSAAQRERRAKLLDQLHAYWQEGVFPKNTYQAGRTPVFIDEQGRLCAVGFLIAQSAGREAVERINERFQLDRIEDMDAPAVEAWAERHGFTLRELAMIQPMYCGTPRAIACPKGDDEDENMRKGIEIASMGLSASAAVVNGYLIGTERRSRWVAGAGLVTGGTSLALGLSGKANYAAGDYALAGASLLLSGWHLLRPGSDGDSDDGEDDPTVIQNEASALPTVRPALVATGGNDYAPGVHLHWQF